MKIKVVEKSYEEVMALPRPKHKNPKKPSLLFRTLVRLLGSKDLKETSFTYTFPDRDKVQGPALILMNHSSFIDLEIVSRIFYPKPYQIVCTSDGLVGKEWLMRSLGCIPTRKFVTDMMLLRDMKHAIKNGVSVLMYPEASYSFDGCATPLPRKMGALIKMLNVPVIMIRTHGALLRDPLYNCLQKRQTPVSADVSVLIGQEEITTLSTQEMEQRLDETFTFDNFREQKENHIRIDEPFRADGLERILFRCSECGCEGQMHGQGTDLTCAHCGHTWTMDEFGSLHGGKFSHIPDWYAWERQNVRQALEERTYRLDTDVTIAMMVDYQAIYRVGKGHLTHDENGFTLTGCEGKLSYHQDPLASYGLYADYYWYELGDIICIGDQEQLYYCFPEQAGVVAKTRLAAEELYKLKKGGNGK